MHVLRIDSGKAYFIISEVKIKPEKLSRDNLLQILNNRHYMVNTFFALFLGVKKNK